MGRVLVVLLTLLGCAARPGPVRPAGEPAAVAAPSDPARAAELRAQAAAAYAGKSYERCADLDDEALPLAPETKNQAYDAACCLALAGRVDGAFARLEVAVALGFRDAGHLAGDPDLGGLHGDARWVGVVEGVRRNQEAFLATINRELAALYEADQADRRLPPAEKAALDIAARDEARRVRVVAILDAGEAKVAVDFFHAAMILQHGHEPADYQRAHDLALKAVELDPTHTTAKWLAAASEDRLLMSRGERQKYGTQFRMTEGRWELYPVDPAVTDAERAAWGVPPLAEAEARVTRMNAGAP